MADFVFHYTSRELAQAIQISGWLRPGRGGKLYLTDDTYEDGAEAAKKLALTGKAVEMVLVVPVSATKDLSEPRPIEPILAPDGSDIRPGGGRERTTQSPVDARPLVIWSLGST